MVKIHPFAFQQRGDVGEIGLSTVDVILAGVVFESLSRDYQVRFWDNLMTPALLDEC